MKSYLLLGAVFGKVIELSGFARSIVTAVIGLVGRERTMPSMVLVCALFILVSGLTYLEWRRRQAAAAGEGYGTMIVNAQPETSLTPVLTRGPPAAFAAASSAIPSQRASRRTRSRRAALFSRILDARTPAVQTLSAAGIRSPTSSRNPCASAATTHPPRAHVHAKRAKVRGGRSGDRVGECSQNARPWRYSCEDPLSVPNRLHCPLQAAGRR